MQLNPQPAMGTLNRKQRRALKKNGARGLTYASEQASSGGISAEIQKAIEFQKSGDFAAAKDVYDSLPKSHPADPELCIALANFHLLQDNLEGAYLALKKAIEMVPDNAGYWSALSMVLNFRSETKAAIIARRKAIQFEPDNVEYYVQLGVLLDAAYNSDGALAAFETAVKLDPNSDRAQLAYGRKLQALGQFQEGKQALWKAVEINPGELTACLSLIRGKGLEGEEVDNLQDRMEKILESHDLTDKMRGAGLTSMAQIHERKKDYDQSFHFYLQANQLDRKEYKFGRERFKGHIDALIEIYKPDVFDHLKSAGNPSKLPTLVVGMPRSGTTLVEQIMGSHSQVFGGGEMAQLQKLDYELSKASLSSDTKYPRDIKEMNCDVLTQFGESHLADLRENYSSDALRIVDKMPRNFMNLALVAVLFPQATIIHTMRDPMDTCWSCFTQNFNNKDALSWTHDLEDAGFYYQQYRRLMDHWHKVLPLKILDVQYEELLDDQEGISRQMIEHIGLDWEEACLKFDEQDQSVQTASAWQVRQPIYKTSVEKWRRYEKHLGPLQQALGPYA